MRNDDVDLEAVGKVVDRQPTQFRTKDVSTDPAIVATHSTEAAAALNTAVGRLLSRDRDRFGIELVDPRPNAVWRRVPVPR